MAQKAKLFVMSCCLALLLMALTPVLAQQSTPPDLTCPSGYTQVFSVVSASELQLNGNLSDDYPFSLAEESLLSLLVASKVGHPEFGCQPGVQNPLEGGSCDQAYQDSEHFSVLINGASVVTVPDHGTDQWLAYPGNPVNAGQLNAGNYQIVFEHAGQDGSTESNSESVGYSAVLCAMPVQPPGFEGCTPGYWKQDQHFDSWVGFTPDQTLESVFDVPDSFGLDNISLVEALNGGGGSGVEGAAKILLRAAVAALLNAANSDVDYTETTAAIIADVNAALASGNRDTMLALASSLDADNNLGCPLN